MLSNMTALLSQSPVVVLIVIITALTSIYSFYNHQLYFFLILHPYSVRRKKKLHALITAALVHTGWFHLLFNLAIIYFLGRILEKELYLMGVNGSLKFLFLYLTGVVVGNFGTSLIHGYDFSYRSAGASGGALAIVAGFCLIEADESYINLPVLGEISNIYFILFFICGLIYELRYRKNDPIDHYVHIFGFVTGVIFIFLFYPKLLETWI